MARAMQDKFVRLAWLSRQSTRTGSNVKPCLAPFAFLYPTHQIRGV